MSPRQVRRGKPLLNEALLHFEMYLNTLEANFHIDRRIYV